MILPVIVIKDRIIKSIPPKAIASRVKRGTSVKILYFTVFLASFFDGIDNWAKGQGASGMAYFTIEEGEKITAKGPVGKFFSSDALKEIMKITKAKNGDSIFFSCNKENEVLKLVSSARDLSLIHI